MTAFSVDLLNWYDRHGRKDLPWQASRDAYSVWVSEIMLQQTQVSAVIPYFKAFMQRFPDIASLADAPLDAVLHAWTGLGYYARARNLQRAAQTIVAEHGGIFPSDYAAVAALPGIGPSTAGAILAFAFGQQHTILDGNVKRVLARYHRVPGWPGKREVAEILWAHARTHTPSTRTADYTQAIMDLGATVCRRQPLCGQCPLATHCEAHRVGDIACYPAPAPRKALPIKSTTMIMIRAGEQVLLRQRPPSGIWGGLWGFPECATEQAPTYYCRDALGLDIDALAPWPALRHTFTHFHLDIVPQPARLCVPSLNAPTLKENENLIWYNLHSPDARGLAAPVKRLLEQLRNTPWPAP